MTTRYLRMTGTGRLTVKQAENLLHAAGNSLDAWDVREALFQNPADANSAIEGADKISRALRAAVNRQPRKRPMSAAGVLRKP